MPSSVRSELAALDTTAGTLRTVMSPMLMRSR